ncbi:MAG: hypothetical protein ACRC30_08330 [Clostridium sp.]
MFNLFRRQEERYRGSLLIESPYSDVDNYKAKETNISNHTFNGTLEEYHRMKNQQIEEENRREQERRRIKLESL